MTIQLPVPYDPTERTETPASAGDHTRHTIFSPQSQSRFLDHLATSGNVRLACKAAGVSPQTAYRARRKSPRLARLWDAALLAARARAEQVLADRALNGVEEAVFYHGEEVATRIRFDSRLLLAHLAWLDKLAEREEVNAALEQLDDAVEMLAKGQELGEELPACVPAEAGTSHGGARPVEAPAYAGEHGPAFSNQDRVPCVPSCRNCGADCGSPDADMTEEECVVLGHRLAAMDAARPEGAKEPWQLAQDHPHLDAQAIENIQLMTFEDRVDEWWLIVPTVEEWEAAAE